MIETDAAGERTFYYWRNDAAARYWLACPEAERCAPGWRRFDYLYLSGISTAILAPADRTKLLALLRRCRPTASGLSSTTTTARACGKAVRKLS